MHSGEEAERRRGGMHEEGERGEEGPGRGGRVVAVWNVPRHP